ncbi:DnaB-like helicase N-terminal domain-containing protein [Streptomyces sp. NPDC050636]|uniref:DnaB-like helicase N-terminal domain-containing protein n=1 Tax=Streptomyces sp. NPDC050636 TaxID=3154510 RepID=UPI0034315661
MTPLVQAEQAVLGAVFLAPGQLDRLSPWLRPEHFSRPVHTALYAAMLKLRADDHPAAKAQDAGPVPMSWMTDTVAEASQHTRGLTASYAHSLVSACPRPEHAVVYGRMVLEGAIHRSVAQHATRLHQAARADAIRRGVEETVHHAEVLSDVLADLARRWGVEPRPVTPSASAPSPPAHPQPLNEQLLADEEFLLGCLSARPQKLDEVVGWLHPGDFADAGHQQIYRSLGALHHRGEPIDQLTVLWETQRRGALADRTLDAERVLRICDPSVFAGSAEYVGEQVVLSPPLRLVLPDGFAERTSNICGDPRKIHSCISVPRKRRDVRVLTVPCRRRLEVGSATVQRVAVTMRGVVRRTSKILVGAAFTSTLLTTQRRTWWFKAALIEDLSPAL